ncbi:methyltransferase domain-containing protein [Deinococcus sp. SDU3-2]|uniref:Methyltransferase domain-containing protein n=1 Tax=Deinococcus terrestris TaxID=2651870 RepID=A0A7X1NWR3_9DEIO|nr:methyltransferase domain-containing protein [Deinococcus terrestris]MPY66816.1 methyltransferase domain-containing protein [Deinococcus terrestris]
MTPGGWRDRDARLSRQLGLGWPEEPLLNALRLSPTARVLDVGAGEGRLLRALRARGHRGEVVGLDPEPGEGVQRGVAEQLPFPDASFDAVLLVRVLAHLHDPARAVAEARRVLRPGGRLVVAAQGEWHLARLRRLGEALWESPPPPTEADLVFPVVLTPEDVRALAASYGLNLSGRDLPSPLTDTLHLRVEVERR